MDKIEVVEHWKGLDDTMQYWWRWKSANGKILATSETYPTARIARRMASKAAQKINSTGRCRYMDLTRPAKKGKPCKGG